MPSAKELRDISKDLGIRGYSKMNKTQLTTAIEGHVKTSDAIVEKSTPKEVDTEILGGHYKQAMGKKDEYDSWKSSRSTPKDASIPEETESEESE